jgi:hypothetical protein
MAKYLDRSYPFKGFLIVSTVIFLFLFVSQRGISPDNNLIKSEKITYLFESQADYDRHLELVKKGHFLYMYLLYVGTSYTIMFLGLCWRREKDKFEDLDSTE